MTDWHEAEGAAEKALQFLMDLVGLWQFWCLVLVAVIVLAGLILFKHGWPKPKG
jgi:hypothetical protein